MATNIKYPGSDTIYWTNGTGSLVASGAYVRVPGHGTGIALADIANGARGSVRIAGIVTVTKSGDTGPVFAQGDPVYVVIATGLAVTNNGTGRFIGFAHRAAATDEASVEVVMSSWFDAPMSVVTAAAAAATTVPADALSPAGVYVNVPNTGAVTVTFPVITADAQGAMFQIHKTDSTAAAITIAAGSGNTIVGTPGTVDAANDRVAFKAIGTTLVVQYNTIA